jgi:hypothetical protein
MEGPETYDQQGRPDAARIDLGIESAKAEDREIDDGTARRIASQFHSGQSSALYSLASSGTIDQEHVYRELGTEYEQQRDPRVQEWINWLGTYCLRREAKGPVKGWHLTTTDD